jgi:hypothetical protein
MYDQGYQTVFKRKRRGIFTLLMQTGDETYLQNKILTSQHLEAFEKGNFSGI